VQRGALASSARLARTLRERLSASPKVRLVEAAAPSTLISFEVRGEGAADVARRLEIEGVLVRSIPGFEWVRASVGFWNDEADVDRLVRAIG
jgi:selenocysteine lyase/cysteine desulfurase